MKDKITKQILRNVESCLSEYDLDGMIFEYTNKKTVKKIVDTFMKDVIIEKVTKSYEEAIFKAIKKQQPLIDAFVVDKVRRATIAADKAMRDNYDK